MEGQHHNFLTWKHTAWESRGASLAEYMWNLEFLKQNVERRVDKGMNGQFFFQEY